MSEKNDATRTAGRIALVGTALIFAVLTAVQTYLYLTGYEFENDLYRPGALPTVTAILWIAAAAGALLLNLRLPGKTVCSEFRVRSTVYTDFASLFGAAALVGTVFLPLVLKNSGTDPLGNLLASTLVSDHTARIMLLLSLVLGIPAAAHFLLRFAKHRSYPQSACALLLWAGFSALRVYFDMRYLLTSPRRILHLMALIAVMLFLIAELRLARGIATYRFYAVSASVTLVIAGCDAVTGLILWAMGWISLGSEICTYLVLLAVALYAAACMASPCTRPQKSVTPAPAVATEAETVTADLATDESEAAE
ncbi:MAG: hypothetical protein IJW62_00895 [Clostridia bacterium]|nr:hypothetical protein [Clostridia bacterium]